VAPGRGTSPRGVHAGEGGRVVGQAAATLPHTLRVSSFGGGKGGHGRRRCLMEIYGLTSGSWSTSWISVLEPQRASVLSDYELESNLCAHGSLT
jgi:hypothetical protein